MIGSGDYKKDIRIDKYDLDNEYERQPALFQEYAELSAEAQYRLDRAEKRMNTLKAILASKIRECPKDYQWIYDRAPTEAFIKEKQDLDEDIQEAEALYFKLKRDSKILEGAVKSFAQRKDAISGLITLWAKQYFSRPYVGKEVRSELNDRRADLTEEDLRDAQRGHMERSSSLRKLKDEEQK